MRQSNGSPGWRYWLPAGLVLALAAFNLTFRLGDEIVVEWDESLYGLSAWEMLRSQEWLGTTFKGSLDYYNTKPPLNIWLISLGFKAFGVHLVSLRLSSILSAWLTVIVLQEWARRTIGPSAAIFASLVLATSFGFLYDHAGRSANTDAPFALLVLLTVVTLWAAHDRPWRLVWLGPIAAAAFLLRGMGVLMPLAIAGAVEFARRRELRHRWNALAVAALLFFIPTATWAWMRWRLDEWRFLGPLFMQDFVARIFTVLDEHPGTPFYHLDVLQRNQFDWLIAGATALFLFPLPWSHVRTMLTFWRSDHAMRLVVGSWVAITLLMPSLIRTKLSWYLNPFYPAFALGLACLFVHGLGSANPSVHPRRKAILVTVIVLACGVAEARLMWYPFNRRNLTRSTQGLLLAERQSLAGGRVFRRQWNNSEVFVLHALVGAEAREAPTAYEFLRVSTPGDYWLSATELAHSDFVLVRSQVGHRLYRRTD